MLCRACLLEVAEDVHRQLAHCGTALRKFVIHGDGNEDNIIVEGAYIQVRLPFSLYATIILHFNGQMAEA